VSPRHVCNIRKPWLRKPAVFVVFAAAMIWHFNWRLITFSLAVILEALCAAIEAGFMAGRDSIRAELSSRSVRILRVVFAKAWSGELATLPQNEKGEGL